MTKVIRLIVKIMLFGLLGGIIFFVLVYFPSFRDSLKRAEEKIVKYRIKEIALLEEAYHKRHGTYVSADMYPQNIAGEFVFWKPYKDHGFRTLGWEPSKRFGLRIVSCRYGVNATQDAYTIEISCASGHDPPRFWGYVKPSPQTEEGLPGPTGHCSAKGVYQENSSPPYYLFETIGLCNAPSQT